MEMRLDFYKKDIVAVQFDLDAPYPSPSVTTSELFLFACLTLRQLYNLSEHLTAKALAGILVSESIFSSICENKTDLRTGDYLLQALKLHVSRIVNETQGTEAAMNALLTLDSRLNFNPYMLETLDNDFLKQVPRLVKPKGMGTKSFALSVPPLKLKTKGFGVLGREVPYYALHSIIAAARKLSMRHKADEMFLEHLSLVAQHCGTAYIFNQISQDQATIALNILKEIGVL
jgi:hypothetical protein